MTTFSKKQRREQMRRDAQRSAETRKKAAQEAKEGDDPQEVQPQAGRPASGPGQPAGQGPAAVSNQQARRPPPPRAGQPTPTPGNAVSNLSMAPPLANRQANFRRPPPRTPNPQLHAPVYRPPLSGPQPTPHQQAHQNVQPPKPTPVTPPRPHEGYVSNQTPGYQPPPRPDQQGYVSNQPSQRSQPNSGPTQNLQAPPRMGGAEQFARRHSTAHSGPAQTAAPPRAQASGGPSGAPAADAAQTQGSAQSAPAQNPEVAAQSDKLKVAIVGPRFMLSGAERLLIDILTHVRGDDLPFEISGLCAIQAELFFPHAEIHHLTQNEQLELLGSMPGLDHAVANYDALLTWGSVPPISDPSVKRVDLDDLGVLPGIDPSRVQPTRSPEEVRRELKIEDGQKVMTFIGNMSNANNPYALSHAIAELGDEWIGLFVGEGNDAVEVRMHAEKKIPKRFRFAGARPDVGDLLAVTDCVLVPALRPTRGFAVLEAWAAGVPVIATRKGHPFGLPSHILEIDTPELDPDDVNNIDLEDTEVVGDMGKRIADAVSRIGGEAQDDVQQMLEANTMERFRQDVVNELVKQLGLETAEDADEASADGE